jgi:hypothetical protein
LKPDAYRAPTDEERAAFKVWQLGDKKARAAKTPKAPELLNLTLEDAERLQAIWNTQQNQRIFGEDRRVMQTTQAKYSEASKGTYARAKTVEITGGGFIPRISHMSGADFPTVAKIRSYQGAVIILADKPQKSAPAYVWEDPRPAARQDVIDNWQTLKSALSCDWSNKMTEAEADIFGKACRTGLAHHGSLTQFGLTDAGREIEKQMNGGAA